MTNAEPAPVSAWRQPGFPRYLAAAVCSSAGDHLTLVAIAVLVYQSTRSAAWLAVMAVARTAAWGVATVWGGVLGDRVPRQRVVVVGNVVAAGTAAGLAVASAASAPVGVVVLLATVGAIVAGLMNPSLMAAVPDLVPEEALAAANGANTTVEQVAMVAGPGLGAILVAAASPTVAIVVDAASYLVAAGLLITVRFRQVTVPDPAGADEGDRADAGDAAAAVGGSRSGDDGVLGGLRAVRRSPVLSALIGSFVLAVCCYGFSTVLFVMAADRRLGLGESGVGYLRTAEGAGGVVAALVAGRLAARGGQRVLWSAYLLIAMAPMALALTRSAPIGLALLLVGGAGFVVYEVTAVTWVQRLTDTAYLSRVMGLLMAAGAAGSAAGAAIAGVMADAVGLQWALVTSGLVMIAPIVVLAPRLAPGSDEVAERADELAPIVEVLGSLSIFAGADQLTLERVAAAVRPETLPIGSVVVREGEPPDDLFVVRSGILDVRSHGEVGGANAFVAVMGPNDWFGEIGLLHGSPRTATVTARTECELWRISGDAFLAALEPATPRSTALWGTMAARLARTHPSWASTV